MTTVSRTKSKETIRLDRRRTKGSRPELWIAPLWPKKTINLGTLSRTCDAVGAGLIVPRNPLIKKALARGNTLGKDKVWISYIHDPIRYLKGASKDHTILALEIAEDSIPLSQVTPADGPTILVLGHESTGIPTDAWQYISTAIEIPMYGVGNSLNIAVAGSLALYKLTGLME